MYLPHRRPNDVDLIIGPTLRAGTQAALAIASLAFDPKAGLSASAAFTDPQQLADGEQEIITTAYGTLHIIGRHLPGSCNRSAIVRRRCWFIVGRYPVAVCSLDDLLEIKKEANHGQDAADVEQLLSIYKPRH